MRPSEIQKHNPKPLKNIDDESTQTLAPLKNQENAKEEEPSNKNCKKMMNLFSFTPLILEPFEWFQMLSSRLDSTFVLGVILVYGLSQGFSGSFFKVVSDYYWKDVQKVQPSAVQLFIGLYYIPWVMKPIWGLLTDVFPVKGYKRRPYFVLAGFIGAVSALFLALSGKLGVALALGFLMGITTGVAIADVTIDACIARKSIEFRSLAPDLQSLCGFCSSVGALIGYSSSGFFVQHLGAQGSLGLLAIPPAALIALGFVIYELKTVEDIQSEHKKIYPKVKTGGKRFRYVTR